MSPDRRDPPPRRPPPDDWGDEAWEDPEEPWPPAPERTGEAVWEVPEEGSDEDPPWDPSSGLPQHDLEWPGDEEEIPPGDFFPPPDPRLDLPPGVRVVGFVEAVDLPDLGLEGVSAECHTGLPESELRLAWSPDPDGARLHLPGGDRSVPLEAGEVPILACALVIAGVRLDGRLRLAPAEGPPLLRIGRDLLAGRFAVLVPGVDPTAR